MYEYGARNYDPSVGRFFNMDNYAEQYLDLTPYQYGANNPVYFIDVNGDYIYIMDKGIRYKFDSGKLFAKDDEGNWAEHTPKAGSFLEQVYMELKSMYEFSGGSTGRTGDGGNSFGKSLLTLFNNDKNNVDIWESSKFPSSYFRDIMGFFNDKGKNLLLLNLNEKIEYYSYNNTFYTSDLMFIIGHELGHALSFYYGIKNRSDEWFTPPGHRALKKDEFFALFIENQLLNQFNKPARINYFTKDDFNKFDQKTIDKGYIINSETGEYLKNVNKHLNDYKKSIPLN
ncbi:RHS repeat-associated core domain-containing protein [Paenimyroides ummariense]|uniref:RHS repeat-associated core domain-containing protein n=2 Tax=Paenimyroides ummariense TaxID=913024 RepID=A0A1I5GSJ5_9FLAO|nr:RHS repeat-associated core domain-containing protein [Paenimyroides ummariense]